MTLGSTWIGSILETALITCWLQGTAQAFLLPLQHQYNFVAIALPQLQGTMNVDLVRL